MRAGEAFAELKKSLVPLYDQREASVIADRVIEEITGSPRIDRIMHDPELSEAEMDRWKQCLDELSEGRPLQYVLGYSEFLGRRFTVNGHVLIPRPETEELTEWLVSDIRPGEAVLDIGTGSGCIPVMVNLLSGADVTSVDTSADALEVARQNAKVLGARVRFIHGDFLDPQVQAFLPSAAIIISNPPYVPVRDAAEMHTNVLAHEPHLALFVPDEDALVFYRNIIGFATSRQAAKVYLETHARYAHAVADLGMAAGYRAEVRKDLSGNDRMVKLWKDEARTGSQP
jgi:release factor glutamine methyltransferase